MAFFEQHSEEASRRLAAQLAPHLAPGEPLDGVVHAVHAKVFSADLYAVGVTPSRLLLLPLDRRMEATAPPVAATRDEITDASVWGWGGSLADFLSATAGEQIRLHRGGGEIQADGPRRQPARGRPRRPHPARRPRDAGRLPALRAALSARAGRNSGGGRVEPGAYGRFSSAGAPVSAMTLPERSRSPSSSGSQYQML